MNEQYKQPLLRGLGENSSILQRGFLNLYVNFNEPKNKEKNILGNREILLYANVMISVIPSITPTVMVLW